MSPLSVIVLTGGSKPGLFSCHAQIHTHTHAHSTCVRLTDSSFITINQLQPPQVCTNPPTAGGKGRRTGERCKRSRPPRRKYVEGNKEKWNKGSDVLYFCVFTHSGVSAGLPEATVLMAPSCPMMCSFSLLSRGNLLLSSASRRACNSRN